MGTGSGLDAKGKLSAVIKDKDGKIINENFFWKGSLDLKQLQFRINRAMAVYNSCERRVQITRLGMISRELEYSEVYADDYKAGKKITGHFVIFSTTPDEDNPEGVNVTLKFSTEGGQNKMFNLLTDWREAATYGF